MAGKKEEFYISFPEKGLMIVIIKDLYSPNIIEIFKSAIHQIVISYFRTHTYSHSFPTYVVIAKLSSKYGLKALLLVDL